MKEITFKIRSLTFALKRPLFKRIRHPFERFEGDEAHIQLFLQDLDQWRMHYTLLQSTSTFLMDACDENIASNLQQKMAVIHCNWSYLLQYAEKYGSDTLNRASFDEELKQLDSWLTRARSSLGKQSLNL